MRSGLLERPLTEPELEELAELLDVLSPEENGMSLSAVDGLLAALMAGPRIFLPSEWLPQLWDPDNGRESPIFADERQAQRFYQLLMTHMNAISRALREAPDAYAALVPQVPAVEFCHILPLADFEPGTGKDDLLVWSPVEWCAGFLTGVRMDMEGWDPFIEEEVDSFGLVVAFGSPEGHEELRTRPPTIEGVDAVTRELGGIASQAHDFFLPVRGMADVSRQPPEPYRRPMRVGRNEPCPCGSGRKFKHCHGGRGGVN